MKDQTRSAPATKGDLAELSGTVNQVKGDLAELSGTVNQVKGDLAKLSETVTQTRGGLAKLSETVTRIAVDLSKTQADVREIKDDISTRLATKGDINRIMKALDTYTGEAISYRNRDILRGNEVMEHTSKLKNHEDRLIVLEAKK